MRNLTRFNHEKTKKKNPVGSSGNADRFRSICTGKRYGGHQRSNPNGNFLFRPRHTAYLCHRGCSRSYRRCKSVQQIQQRRSRYEQNRCKLVWGLYLPDRSGYHLAFLLPLKLIYEQLQYQQRHRKNGRV